MKETLLRQYPTGLLLGFGLGFLVIHPFSMIFQGMVHPDAVVEFRELADAFSPHHIPMAFFFGVLGAAVGVVNLFYLRVISRERERVKLLEGLLPICSYCKKIRDDEGRAKGEGDWIEVERYLGRETDLEFTHGMCPDCYERVMEELEEEETAAPCR